jgi:tetratricopeptide (TPR) repeat protein
MRTSESGHWSTPAGLFNSPPVSTSVASNLAQALAQAVALHRQGDLAQAEKIYARIIKARRDHFDALHLLGLLKHQAGKAGEAYRLISAALAVNPRSADAHSNFGLVLHALKRDDDALASFERALALDPAHVEALNNRGTALLNRGRAAEALASFERLLTINPRHPEAQVNRANALLELERVDEAIAGYDAVLAAQPRHAGAHFNRGNALMRRDRLEEAIAAFDRAIAIAPGYVKAHNNRGLALRALNRHEEALASYGRATALDKDFAEAHLNAAHAMLALGDFARGFAAYEWRWKTGSTAPHRRAFRQPLWLGTPPIGGKTLLLHAEQGLGDTIQFARYVEPLVGAGAKVVLEVAPPLKQLLSGMDGAPRVIAHREALPPFDVHCPLASLPLACKTELAAIPAEIPYLAAPAERLEKWRERMDALPRPRIALAWSGNPVHANDRNRSIALSRLEPLWSVEGASFISVQRELREADAAALAATTRLVHLGDELTDFADTAAVLALADRVISVDSAVAHLAGAMGRPIWILLPFSPDWRWMRAREDSPWYPTARLFRQPAIGDWESVIARVRDEIERA